MNWNPELHPRGTAGTFTESFHSPPESGISVPGDEDLATTYLPDIPPAIGAAVIARSRELFGEPDHGTFFVPVDGQQEGYLDIVACGTDESGHLQAQKFTHDSEQLTDYTLFAPAPPDPGEPFEFPVPRLTEPEQAQLNEAVSNRYSDEPLLMVPPCGVPNYEAKSVFALDGNGGGTLFTLWAGGVDERPVG